MKYPVLEVSEKTTDKQIFQAVVKHLRRQGGPSRNKWGCMNRSDNGRACAVACLVGDDKLNLLLASGWVNMPERAKKDFPNLYLHDRLLSKLQYIHDESHSLDEVNFELQRVADLIKCKFTPLEKWEMIR